jgi:Protein of unknown function (DUF3037)
VAADGGCGMTGARMGFQYVVLRCVPRVDREEFLNVGVVLYCQQTDFLQARWRVDEARLSALEAVQAVCRGDESAGEAAREPIGTRFGFVKAPRSTVVQPGPVHGGSTNDPSAELDRLLDRLVG